MFDDKMFIFSDMGDIETSTYQKSDRNQKLSKANTPEIIVNFDRLPVEGKCEFCNHLVTSKVTRKIGTSSILVVCFLTIFFLFAFTVVDFHLFCYIDKKNKTLQSLDAACQIISWLVICAFGCMSTRDYLHICPVCKRTLGTGLYFHCLRC